MKKNVILFCMATLLLMVLLVLPLVNAEKITYSNNKLNVTISNSILFGLIKTGDLGSMELKSHKSVDQVIQVSAGNQVVMYYDFNFNKGITNGLGEVTFTDMRTGKEVDRDYYYVYWGDESYESPVYNYVENPNGTKSYIQTGTETLTRENWIPYNSKDIPEGNIRIGIQVEVKNYDWIDGIWTVAGKQISEHAEWSTPVTDAHGQSSGGTSSLTQPLGMTLFNKNDVPINITIITKSTLTTATYGSIKWYNGTNLTKVLLVGNDGYIGNISIPANTPFIVDFDSDGASYTRDAFGTFFPQEGTNINWTGGAIRGVIDLTSSFNLKSITTALPATLSNPVLISPKDGANFTTNTINFSANISDSLAVGIANVSLYINGTINQTNSSGIEGIYNFSALIPNGYWNWTVKAFGDDNFELEASNGTLDFNVEDYFNNGYTYNSTTAETALEKFYVNITTDGTTPTNGKLIYNGTSYGATITSTGNNNFNISKSIYIPLQESSNTFYFNFTLGGTEYSTASKGQQVNLTYFTLCNTTYTTEFLNVTFRDEGNFSGLNASMPTSTFTYYLGNGTLNKTYTFVNTSENTNYSFCATPDRKLSVLPYIQYKNDPNFPQRIWSPALKSYSSTLTNQILYLLKSTDGIYVTFQVVNTADQTIDGVDVTATRTISGSTVEVGHGTTDAAGSVTFWLNPDFVHTFNFSKSGFTTLSTSFAPTQTSYTITLSGGSSSTSSYYRGIDYEIIPTNTSLTNDTFYTFGFNLTSSFWSLDSYGFDLRLSNGTTLSGGSTSTSGTLLSLSYNTTNQSRIYMDYYWLINGTYTNGTRVWNVYSTSNTQWSIRTFFDDLKTYLDSGFFGIDNFGRYLIIFIVMFLIIGGMSYKYGITSPLVVVTMIFLVTFFFDVVVGIIPDITIISGVQVPNLLTYLTGLIMVAVFLREMTK